jgi:RNA 2',3'-cyclic 3'-phosphodiesterase
MNSIRAFIAVEIDSASKQKISGLINDLKQTNADVRWASENQMHLTLKFLGNIEQGKISLISAAIKTITGHIREFDLSFSGIGAFPAINRPRLIWAGIDKGSNELRMIAGLIEKEMGILGFDKEGRDYKAHLTLGRVGSQKKIKDLTKKMAELEFKFDPDTKVNKLVLFQSTLTPKGTIHTPLQKFPLSKK